MDVAAGERDDPGGWLCVEQHEAGGDPVGDGGGVRVVQHVAGQVPALVFGPEVFRLVRRPRGDGDSGEVASSQRPAEEAAAGVDGVLGGLGEPGVDVVLRAGSGVVVAVAEEDEEAVGGGEVAAAAVGRVRGEGAGRASPQSGQQVPAGERGEQPPVRRVVDGVEQRGGEALQPLQVLVAGG